MFGFANLAHEFNFGALLLFFCKFWFGLVGLVLKVWFGRISFVGMVW